MGSQLNEIQGKIVFWMKEKIWDMQQVRLLLWDSPLSLGSVLVPGFSWLPPVPGSLCVCSPVGFAPNLLIPDIF